MERVLVKALALLDRAETCILGSIDRNGYPAMRAMLQPRKRTGMKQILFSTNTSSRHIEEYRNNPLASVYFYDPQLFQGLLLRGRMEVSTDQMLRDGIWREGDEMYYKLGPTDPDYAVMLFTADNGRWYEDMKSYDIKSNELI